MTDITQNAGHPGEPRLRPHTFDGIQEFDNRLPNWWLWSLYLSCIFSVGYWIHYHVLGTGPLPTAAYLAEKAEIDEEMAAAAAAQPVTDESLLELVAIPAEVEKGREIFKINCVACHAEQGNAVLGGVELPGPNLTDAYWLHGGKPTQIFHTITEGVPDKGMVPWKFQLGDQQRRQVAAFVLSIKNTNVEGRAPQGELEK